MAAYGAEGWTLHKPDEKKINSAEMWFYMRVFVRVSWKEKRTDDSISNELKIQRQLLNVAKKSKLPFLDMRVEVNVH